MAMVVVLPLTQLLVEQRDVVADAVGVQELIALLVVHAVRALELTVQVRCPRANVDVPDLARFEVPVELGLELCAVVPSES